MFTTGYTIKLFVETRLLLKLLEGVGTYADLNDKFLYKSTILQLRKQLLPNKFSYI